MANKDDKKREIEAMYAQPFMPNQDSVSPAQMDRHIRLRQLAALEYIAAQLGIIARQTAKK